jgi:subtilisin family serine protease
MSGTSFAAPVVAGAAAQLAYRHPDWTPGQIKGALMLTARPIAVGDWSAGVGEVDAGAAANAAAPPNANKNLDAFVVTDPLTGQKSFDVTSWVATILSTAGWSSAGWAEASWAGANWSGAAWASASWAGANWTSSTSSAYAGWAEAGWAEANGAE